MVETTILGYLNDMLDVPALMELPEVPSEAFPEWPNEFVIIERVGMRRENHVKCASIAFQSYSMTSMYNAALLDERVREAMDSMAELSEIGGLRLASNYNFTDTSTKRYRYQCVYDIYYV